MASNRRDEITHVPDGSEKKNGVSEVSTRASRARRVPK